jgi:hypothetical protein
MLSVNWKHVQLVKIYMSCNFEVNLITRLTFWKFGEKKGNNSKLGNQIYFKIAGHVDLDMLHMFAV